MKLSEADVITVRKKAVCPRCGMTVAEGGENVQKPKNAKQICMHDMRHDGTRRIRKEEDLEILSRQHVPLL